MNQRKKLVIILDEDHRMQIIVAWAYVLCRVARIKGVLRLTSVPPNETPLRASVSY